MLHSTSHAYDTSKIKRVRVKKGAKIIKEKEKDDSASTDLRSTAVPGKSQVTTKNYAAKASTFNVPNSGSGPPETDNRSAPIHSTNNKEKRVTFHASVVAAETINGEEKEADLASSGQSSTIVSGKRKITKKKIFGDVLTLHLPHVVLHRLKKHPSKIHSTSAANHREKRNVKKDVVHAESVINEKEEVIDPPSIDECSTASVSCDSKVTKEGMIAKAFSINIPTIVDRKEENVTDPVSVDQCSAAVLGESKVTRKKKIEKDSTTSVPDSALNRLEIDERSCPIHPISVGINKRKLISSLGNVARDQFINGEKEEEDECASVDSQYSTAFSDESTVTKKRHVANVWARNVPVLSELGQLETISLYREPEDINDIFGKQVAAQLKLLSPKKQILARRDLQNCITEAML